MIAHILAALAAVSTFSEPETSPPGEVMGVCGDTLRVQISGIESSEVELRFALKNSNDEFAEFEEYEELSEAEEIAEFEEFAEAEEIAETEETAEPAEFEEPENEGVYFVTHWKSEQTDKTVLTISGADWFEITGLAPGDYTLIPLVTKFTEKSSEFILVGAGEYPFSIISEDEPNISDNSDSSESSESLESSDSSENSESSENSVGSSSSVGLASSIGLVSSANSESSERLESSESSENSENSEGSEGSENSGNSESSDEPAVVNITYVEKKLALPETGGRGSEWYYIVGGTIITVSGAVLAARFKGRRK